MAELFGHASLGREDEGHSAVSALRLVGPTREAGTQVRHDGQGGGTGPGQSRKLHGGPARSHRPAQIVRPASAGQPQPGVHGRSVGLVEIGRGRSGEEEGRGLGDPRHGQGPPTGLHRHRGGVLVVRCHRAGPLPSTGAEGLTDGPPLKAPVREIDAPRHDSRFHSDPLFWFSASRSLLLVRRSGHRPGDGERTAWLGTQGLVSPIGHGQVGSSGPEGLPVGLPHPEEGNLVQVHHHFGRLEPGHALFGEPPTAFVDVDGRAADDEGGDPFTQSAVGTTHHDGLADLGMEFEDPFHLGRGDVLPSPG